MALRYSDHVLITTVHFYTWFLKVFRSPKISRVSEQRAAAPISMRAAIYPSCVVFLHRSPVRLSSLRITLFRSVFVSFFRHSVFRFSLELVCVRLCSPRRQCSTTTHVLSKSICNNTSSGLGCPYKTNRLEPFVRKKDVLLKKSRVDDIITRSDPTVSPKIDKKTKRSIHVTSNFYNFHVN